MRRVDHPADINPATPYHPLASLNLTPPHTGANSLRCPEGCAFSVRPAADSLLSLNGSALVPVVSEAAATPTMAEAEEGTVRVELKLASGFDDEDLLLIKQARIRHA